MHRHPLSEPQVYAAQHAALLLRLRQHCKKRRNLEIVALRIAEDMRSENPERLAAIRKTLEDESREQYWEFTDRGVNFSYLPPDRRAQLPRFFDLLAAL